MTRQIFVKVICRRKTSAGEKLLVLYSWFRSFTRTRMVVEKPPKIKILFITK